jgi:hypothetical protein
MPSLVALAHVTISFSACCKKHWLVIAGLQSISYKWQFFVILSIYQSSMLFTTNLFLKNPSDAKEATRRLLLPLVKDHEPTFKTPSPMLWGKLIKYRRDEHLI